MIFTANVSGYEVTYDNSLGLYQVIEGETVVKESKSLEAINKFIETGGEKKEKVKRINKEAIYNDYQGYHKVIITSVTERYYGDYEQVCITNNGKRQKEYLSSLIDYTPENLQLIKKIKEAEKEMTKYNNIKDNLCKQLTLITIDMLKEEEK